MSISNPKFAGRALLLKIGDSAVPSTANFTTIGACRMSSLAINQEEIDVTDKDDDPWMKQIEGGVRHLQLSLNGLATANVSFELMHTKTLNGNLWSYQIVFTDGDNYKCLFLVTAFTIEGDYKDGQKFTATLKSADTPIYTNV